tara:strand:- start:100 stop:471 length:372 start_codon:yes stop_codon:yes gene_type:complete
MGFGEFARSPRRIWVGLTSEQPLQNHRLLNGSQNRTLLRLQRIHPLSAKRTATSWSVKVRCGAFSGQNSTFFVTGGIDRFRQALGILFYKQNQWIVEFVPLSPSHPTCDAPFNLTLVIRAFGS